MTLDGSGRPPPRLVVRGPTFRPSGHGLQRRPDVHVQAQRASGQPVRHLAGPEAYADVARPAVVRGHPPERVLDDPGGVVPHAELQIEGPPVHRALGELTVASGGLVPSPVLDERVVGAEVHGHGTAATRAARHQLGRDPHVPLLPAHPADHALVVVCALAAGARALPQPVVALRVEQAPLVETEPLEAVVHVGGQDEVVPAPQEVQEPGVGAVVLELVAVQHDRPAPVRPLLLEAAVSPEAGDVHVRIVVPSDEVGEVPLVPLAV